jgi:transcriptional regulator with XRE-family HTH domain
MCLRPVTPYAYCRGMAHELHTYIAETGKRKSHIARELGVSPGALGDWLSGRRKPGRAVAVKLEKISNGRVPVDCWDIEE